MNLKVIIPAHLASLRLKEKILIDIHGLPMIEHVRRRVLLSKEVSEVIVATCDFEIKKIVEGFGGKVVIEMLDGKTIEEEKEVADAHPSGLRPFKRENYVSKFKELTDGIISKSEANRFLDLAQNLKNLKSKDLKYLNPKIKSSLIKRDNKKTSIFS